MCEWVGGQVCPRMRVQGTLHLNVESGLADEDNAINNNLILLLPILIVLSFFCNSNY